jgi:type I restriction enzyme S subunit
MKQGWEMKKLGDLLTIERGGSPRPIEKYLTNSPEGINWIKISDATASEKYIFETKEKISRDGLNKTRIVNEGDFILSNSMSFGKPYIMKTTGCIHDGWLVLRQNDKKYFETEFLYYLLSSPIIAQQFNFLAAGSTVRNLNIGLVSTVSVPLPPLAEQQRIVSILDKAFAAIDKAKANAERNLQNARELFESYLTGVFEQKGEGWEEKRLGDTCIVERGSSPRPIEKYQTDSPDGVNWIKIGDTKGVDKYIYFTKEKITREGAEKSRYVKEGDFILSNSMSFGKPYIMKTDGYIHDGWFVLRLPNYLDKDYFYYLLTSPNVQKQIQSLGAGAIVKNISGDLVKKVDVFFPKSKEQQQSIVHQLDALRVKIQQLEAAYRQKITDLEEMKKSILQKAFSGELKTT